MGATLIVGVPSFINSTDTQEVAGPRPVPGEIGGGEHRPGVVLAEVRHLYAVLRDAVLSTVGCVGHFP